jgi:hypothetical protein
MLSDLRGRPLRGTRSALKSQRCAEDLVCAFMRMMQRSEIAVGLHLGIDDHVVQGLDWCPEAALLAQPFGEQPTRLRIL